MSSWIEVGKTGELVKGTMKEVLIKGQEILLVRVGDNYYSSDNRCPHMGGKLSQGQLDGAVVTCPRHGSQFDVTDGKVVRWLKGTGFFTTLGKMLKSQRPIRTYPVKLKDDRIMVQIPDKAFFELLSRKMFGCIFPLGRGQLTDYFLSVHSLKLYPQV